MAFHIKTIVRFLVIISTFIGVSATPDFKNRLHSKKAVDPDAYRNVSQLITSKGYPFEQHLVQTADGYILGLHRISKGRKTNGSSLANRPVVLLQHGLLSCSACWVENLVDQSLGFILADRGMDVWMGNSRGNTYSKRHKTLKPTDEQYWAFSWDEMAKYDLPATVDYILKTTNVSQIYYVGHSQGTEIFFAEIGRNQKLASKIKHFFALAPVTTIGHVRGPFKKLAPLAEDLGVLFKLLGKGELFPTSEFIRKVGRDVCGNGTVGGLICENFLFFLAGYDFREMNVNGSGKLLMQFFVLSRTIKIGGLRQKSLQKLSRIPVYVAEHPSGTSVQNLVHYAQSVLSGKFQMYDYGSPKLNMEHYNQTSPPLYDASQMKNNVTLYSGGRDILADKTDVNNLLKQLPNIYHHVYISTWEHLDFIWAIEAGLTIYQDITETIQQYEHHLNLL